jgi:hypothetical protein
MKTNSSNDVSIDRQRNLSQAEFADAIAKGLGRAYLYVRDYGLDDVKDLVLAACLQDLAYDPQCEKSRAKWLFSMFANSQYYPEFRERILATLAVEDETWDLLQLCQLAKEMAMAGDNLAGKKLADRIYERAATRSSDDWIGVDELIEWAGMDAAIELARIYGKRLLADPQDRVPDTLSFFTNLSAQNLEIFDRHALTDRLVATYRQYLIDARISAAKDLSERRSPSPERTLSVEKIIARASQKQDRYPAFYMQFGRQAPAVELDRIFDLLLTESDEDIYLRLLWVFWRTPLPRLDDRILASVDRNSDLIRSATISAISQIKDDRIHQLARSKVLTGIDDNTLDLFINNYHAGDAQIILTSLNEIAPDREDLHAIGTSIIRICEKQHHPELVPLLAWIYDRTPCSDCRQSIVTELENIGKLAIISQPSIDGMQSNSISIEPGVSTPSSLRWEHWGYCRAASAIVTNRSEFSDLQIGAIRWQ